MDRLRDAQAMEEQAQRMMSSTASRIHDHPEVRARLESHAETSRHQAALVKAGIERRGGDTSTLDDLAGRITATAQGLSGMFVSDEIVKATMASPTFSHMEIASCHAPIVAAEMLGDSQTQQVCEQILAQEETMTAWLATQLPLW